ncbi:hypothetical protein PHLGIDRAFT_19661 [Phlebiopsis gigantea 11061_1 CR5-6]|uniref:Uncharacterized protein n=1 Tax=Phlebiopsis gigantea (strain 11061_1 CR5-6) TaxID=745531 RepID=A0A0C3NKP6_PHLG1|nr:hypothetical protein PHLGIDRAFT_19661 [Phlebiopsis gigantea 11061_1 CR5-6]
MRKQPAPTCLPPDNPQYKALALDTSTRPPAQAEGGQGARVSKPTQSAAHSAPSSPSGNSVSAQQSAIITKTTSSKKRRAPSDSPHRGTSSRPVITKRRRVIRQEPVSIPSSPEPPEPKGPPTHTNRLAVASDKPSPGSAKASSRSSTVANNSSHKLAKKLPNNAPSQRSPGTKPTVVSRDDFKSFLVPTDNHENPLPSSKFRKNVLSPAKTTSLPSMSEKAKGKQPIRPSGSRVAPTRTVSASSTRQNDLISLAPIPSKAVPPKPLPKMPKGLDLSMGPEEMGGMLVTWDKIDAGLLSIGRARYKERTARSEVRST